MTDSVNGTVIGAVYRVGRLYYDGRPQSGQLYGESTAELQEKAKVKLGELKQECGDAFKYIYPTDNWELREYLD